MTAPLALEHASKAFGAVQACDDVSIELTGGEVHGLVGENGAGKSTVVKMLGGVHRPDRGRIIVEGVPRDFPGPSNAREAGIAVIHQEPTMFPDLSIADNIFMSRQPLKGGRRIDRGEMYLEVETLTETLGVPLDPRRPALGLSIADQQIVEIAKALSLHAKVIVMDEPTAALSVAETDRLFGIVRTLQAGGAAVLFVTHRLPEIFVLCQRVTVMRDGHVVSSSPVKGLTTEDLVRRMVGRDLQGMFEKQPTVRGDVALSVRGLGREGVFRNISFDVHKGEIVGVAGLVGAGRSEVARAIFGIDRYDHGQITVRGHRLPRGSVAASMAAGVAYVPEDRRQQGLVMGMPISRNIGLASMDHLRRGPFMKPGAELGLASEWSARLRLKFRRLTDPASSLSGGGQQKAVLAKWLARRPEVLIADEPTRGIDVGTKAEVHRILSELAAQGVAVLMISSELPEILGMADRVLVIHEGRLAATLSREQASEESIMLVATGHALAGAA